MTTAPVLTADTIAYLAGRPVHVRSSRRHGCCGGTASVPTAEVGVPAALEGFERFDVSGTTVYVDARLVADGAPWAIDVDGFARWRRLVVVGLGLAATDDPRAPQPSGDIGAP